jgi:hypothetical protein
VAAPATAPKPPPHGGARRREFLAYDWIGAPWLWHPDRRVGNGEFSLRSARLMRFLADPANGFPQRMPTDDRICRRYRPALEAQGFRCAPEELAVQFAFECSAPPGATFGFHDARNWPAFLPTAEIARRLAHPYARRKFGR